MASGELAWNKLFPQQNFDPGRFLQRGFGFNPKLLVLARVTFCNIFNLPVASVAHLWNG